MQSKRKIALGMMIVCLSLGLMAGCADNRQVTKPEDEFIDKWQAKAEATRKAAPVVKQEKIDPVVKTIQKLPDPVTPAIAKAKQRPLPKKRVSLKMSNVDVAVLLRALARAADVNIVLNEKVTGKSNVNISRAPWDQVFLSILRTHGLGYAWQGDIIRIMTADDMDDNLRREARMREQLITEAPLTRIVPIKFSEAEKLRDNLARFLTTDKAGNPIGSILVDQHTNSVIVNALRRDMQTILAIVERLDKPTPQVLIEAHIVEANRDVARELGIRWGFLGKADRGAHKGWLTGEQGTSATGQTLTPEIDPASGANVNLPADALRGFSAATIGVLYQNVGDALLSVQLSALQDQGKLNILSSPSITTLDNQTALIESGSDVPFQTVEDGEVKVEYKEAVLSLEVTPHVIDGSNLKLDIKVKKDEPDFSRTVLGNPTIITKRARTNVIQADGGTLVIGGLNKETTTADQTGVPVLGDLPGLGYLFKTKGRSNQAEDLLIFITPYILLPAAAGGN
jgi:type IV pilus assembly protein PilQ